MNTMYIQILLVAEDSLKYSGMAKKMYMKLLSWIISELHWATWSISLSLTTERHSHMPSKWYVCHIKQMAILTHPCMQLSAVQSLHDQHYIHCDIKSRNFMICTDGIPPTLSLINFSLAWLFHNPATYLHVPFTTDHSIIGTISLFIQHSVSCLGPAILQAKMWRQLSIRKHQSP